MGFLQWRVTAGLAIVMAIMPAMQAQQNVPHVAYVYPAGGRQGTTFEVTVGGQFLDGTHDVYISGNGVQATVVDFVKPLPPVELNNLREQLQKMAERRPGRARQQGGNSEGNMTPAPGNSTWTVEDTKTFMEIRQKIADSMRRTANPAMAQTATLQVTIAPDVAPGERELRLATTAGLTNPIVFCVDQLPEFSKKRAQVNIPSGQGAAAALQNQQRASAPEPPADITLPAILNGQIMPGAVDRYRFHASKGQHLVIAAKARELIPYISDAVPGWFQAMLALYDGKGNEIAYADHYRFNQDPVLYQEIAEDGDYMLEVRDSIYRGREDFIYRISLGELPFVTGIFPLGGKTGTRTAVEMTGWNLPKTRITEAGHDAGIQMFSVSEGEWNSNPVSFALDTLPEQVKQPAATNDAKRIKLPTIINGRIAHPGTWDVFRFEGSAGEEIVAEVFARRLNSPLDSVLKLTDASGTQLAINDDCDDPAAALITHQADSRIFIKLPSKGAYYLYIGDAQHHGGPEFAYRLRISHPRPDFELRVVPSSINLRPGMTTPVTVYALRRDGFSGDITLRLKDAPSRLQLSGGRIPGGQDHVRVTLTAPLEPLATPHNLYLEGEALIHGKKVRHRGMPAEDMMQAFASHHLVPAKNALVIITGNARRAAPWKLLDDEPLKLPAGGTAQVRLVVPFARFADQLQLALNEPPDGIAIVKVARGEKDMAIVLSADGGKLKPGMKGNLIVDAFMQRAANPANPQPGANNRRFPIGTLPAIPFEVVER